MIFNFKTTGGGDADTLQGHGAEYFGKSSEVTSEDGGRRNQDTDIADYRQKMVFIGLKEGTAINLPVCSYSYVFGLQGWTDQSGGLAHELAFNDMGIFRRRVYDDNTKTNWTKISDSDDLANYLPLTGGTLAANATINSKLNNGYSSPAFYIEKANSNEICGGMGVYSDPTDNGAGKYVFIGFSDVPYDAKNSLTLGADFIQWKGADLLHTGNMANHVLPLTGATHTGEFTVTSHAKNGRSSILKNSSDEYDFGTLFVDCSADGKLARIEVSALNNTVKFIDNASKEFSLLHTGNSAKVHIGTSAPSDTSALWIDTSA